MSMSRPGPANGSDEATPSLAADGILFFGEDWGRHSSTGQFLAEELAKSYKLLWVDSLGLRAPRLTGADIRRAAAKIFGFARGLVKRRRTESTPIPEGITVLPPIAIPYWKHGVVRTFNRALVGRLVRRALAKNGIRRPVIITACPATAVFLDDLPAVARVYYCADEHSTLPGMDPSVVRPLEEELMSRVDLVVATSAALEEEKSRHHHDVRYLPHGVDYEHFAQAFKRRLEKPSEIAEFQNPLVGFVGLIGEHLDFDIFREVATRLPDAQLILIGPTETRPEGLDLPNVSFLGARSRSELPAYLAWFDVCLVPYAWSDRIRYANPTKCREYLAAGCPVVSTPQEEARRIGGDIRFVDGKEDFAEAVRGVLEEGTDISREERSEAVRSQTWAARADSLLKMIREVVEETRASDYSNE
jgi:glycosyltransferase involved in cell wall biosynthesis